MRHNVLLGLARDTYASARQQDYMTYIQRFNSMNSLYTVHWLSWHRVFTTAILWTRLIPSTASSFHKPFQRHQLCRAVPFNIFQLPSSLSISFRPAIHADAIVAWQFQLLRTLRPPSFVSKVLQDRCVIVKALVGFRQHTCRSLSNCKVALHLQGLARLNAMHGIQSQLIEISSSLSLYPESHCLSLNFGTQKLLHPPMHCSRTTEFQMDEVTKFHFMIAGIPLSPLHNAISIGQEPSSCARPEITWNWSQECYQSRQWTIWNHSNPCKTEFEKPLSKYIQSFQSKALQAKGPKGQAFTL